MFVAFISLIREAIAAVGQPAPADKEATRPPPRPVRDTPPSLQRLIRDLNEPLGSDFVVAGLVLLPRFAGDRRRPLHRM